jgi:hypothetical protein
MENVSLKDLLPMIGVVVGALLGWFFSQLGQWFVVRREERKAVARVLSDLLEIRHRLLAIPKTVEVLSERFSLPLGDEMAMKMKVVLSRIFPADEELAKRYQESVSLVAESNPILGFQLRSKDVASPLLEYLRELAIGDSPASAVLFSKLEKEFLSHINSDLELLIKQMARTHGWRTWFRIRQVLNYPLELPESLIASLKAGLPEESRKEQATTATSQSLQEADRSLTVGVLIIGSLYWEGRGGNIRSQWRESRLEVGAEKESVVKAPIRYGRIAESRNNTYTMVFSRCCLPSHQLGRAKVLWCKQPITSISALKEEAAQLWRAERNRELKQEESRISADWGCVALLINPKSSLPPELLKGWATFVAEERERMPRCASLDGAPDEGALVDFYGLLRIPWPELLSGNGPLPDLLLATATKPEPRPVPDYPGAKVIAQACIDNQYADYFWSNYESGIRTFQDEAIKEILETAGLKPPASLLHPSGVD